MKDMLHAHGNKTVDFVDAEAETLIFQLGFIDKFTRDVPTGPIRQVVFHTEHKTHWIIALKYTGYPNSKDNGFLARCYPRTGMDFMAFKSVAVREFGIRPEDMRKVVPFGGKDDRN